MWINEATQQASQVNRMKYNQSQLMTPTSEINKIHKDENLKYINNESTLTSPMGLYITV